MVIWKSDCRSKPIQKIFMASDETMPSRPRSLGIAAALLILFSAGAARAEQPVTLFAAASTTNAVEAIARAYEESGQGKLRPVFASSSTLARQIAQGAPADLFLSANNAWIDYLSERGALEAGTRTEIMGNVLVLIAPDNRPLTLTIEPGFPLAAALGNRRLVLGDPAHVPAGIYAKAALENLGVWPEVSTKIAYAGNVRAALALVDRGEAGAGIVYATDASISRRVRIVGSFPAKSHPPIVYTLALVAGRRNPQVTALYDFLRGPEARAIFRAQGFAALNAGD